MKAISLIIITEVDNPDDEQSAVGLCVLNPTGMFFNQHVPFGTTGGHWHWPTREGVVVEEMPHVRGRDVDEYMQSAKAGLGALGPYDLHPEGREDG
jgi:hypothetical protein